MSVFVIKIKTDKELRKASLLEIRLCIRMVACSLNMMKKVKEELETKSSCEDELSIKELQNLNTSILMLSSYLERLKDFELYKLEN